MKTGDTFSINGCTIVEELEYVAQQNRMSESEKEELKRKIMCSTKSDIQKMKAIFDLEKIELKKRHTELYYTILGVLDDAKMKGEL